MFDFLPDNNNQGGAGAPTEQGGKTSIGNSVFYDQYQSHFDAHKLISTPPIRSQFKLQHNFDYANNQTFNEQRVKSNVNNGWYGDSTDYEKLVNGYTEFTDPKLLAKTISQIKGEIPSSLFAGLEKPKMNINDRFGIFSFDLASMAMTYVYEYFDKKGQKVDSNFVYKVKNKFYSLETKQEVEQRIKRRKNGTPVVVSSVRNCMIDFEKKEQNERAVEIIINSSFAGREKASKVLYNAMAGISVAQNLILKGFKVKVTSLLTVNNKENKNYYHFVPVKRYNQPLDINAAAYVCGDARFYRYQGFKMYIWGYDQDNEKTPQGIGIPIENMTDIALEIEENYVPNSQLKQADTRLYFGGSRSLSAAKKEVEKAIEILNRKYGKDENS